MSVSILAYNLVCGTNNFCKPSLVSGPKAVLFLDSLSTKTWAYPPAAAGVFSFFENAHFVYHRIRPQFIYPQAKVNGLRESERRKKLS